MGTARALVGLWMPCPQIVTDEVRFIGLANDLAHASSRDALSAVFSYPFAAYPAVIAPLFWFVPGHTYLVAKLLNAFLISSVCFPAWFLARRALRPRAALIVALLSLCLPALGYASNVMAENLFYPLCLWAFELGLRWRTRRRAGWGALLALVASALVLTRAQGWFILAAIAAWPLLPAFGGGGRYRLGWLARFGMVVLAAAGASILDAYWRIGPGVWSRFWDASTWLGSYATLLRQPEPRDWTGELRLWGASVLGTGGELLPLLGVAWLAASVDAAIAGRSRGARLLGAVALPLWVLFTRDGIRLAVYFDHGPFVHERYSACLASVALVLLVEVATRRRSWLGPALLAAGVGGVGLAFLCAHATHTPHLVADSPGLSWTMAFRANRAALALTLAALGCGGLLWWLRARPAAMAGLLGGAMLLTSFGMALAQHRLVSEDMGRHQALIPFARRLAAEGRRFVVLVDGIDIHEVWNAETFSNEGEGKAFCLDGHSDLCWPVAVNADGRLPELERLPRGMLILAREPIELDAPVRESEGSTVAYEPIGGPLRLRPAGQRAVQSP